MSAVAMVLATERENVETNTAKVTNIIEAAAKYLRNMFLKLKSQSNVTPRLCTVSDGVLL